MVTLRWLCHDGLVTSPPLHLRVPRSTDRVLAGVASGYADRWRVEPTVVRAAVGLLTLVGGIGLVLYGIGAALSSPPLPTDAPRRQSPLMPRRHAAIAGGTSAVLLAARSIGLWPGDEIMAPATAVAVGTSLAWSFGSSTATSAERGRGRTMLVRVVQVVAGVALLVAGVLSLANRTGGLAGVGASASAIAVVVGGLVIFAAPAVGRIFRALDDERALRIREDDSARRSAAHLHDSVLQSLVLMQRTTDPRRMATLARRQERELRAWLYGTQRPGVATTCTLRSTRSPWRSRTTTTSASRQSSSATSRSTTRHVRSSPPSGKRW